MLTPTDKVLPNALDTELALLNSVLVDPNRTMLEAGSLPVAAFYSTLHGRFWQAALELYNKGSSIGLETILESASPEVRDDLKHLLTVILTREANGFPSMAGDYVKIILERWHRRRLIETGHKLMTQAFDDGTDAEAIAAETMHHLTHLNLHVKGPAHVSQYVDAAQARINKAILEHSEVTGLDTGLRQLNLYTHGLTAPDLWILAARPSLGKTSLATTIGINVANKSGKVLIFSLEQSGCALTQRMIAAQSRVNMRKLRNLPDDQVNDITHAMQTIRKLPLWVDERGGLTITQIRADARRIQAVNGLDLIIVDYIGITRPTHPRMDRYEHLTEVSGELKNMAKELNVPVLALSQLNRMLAKERRRPRPDDLRESGAIEQDADVIILLSSDVEVTDLPDVWQPKITSPADLENVVLCDVAKNREGSTGWAFLKFNKVWTRYDDFTV
jgi:replicative DNA helicase